MLHRGGLLVHGRGDPQEDLLSPGDPAGGRGEAPAQRVAAADGQGPLPAFPIATREESRDARQASQVSPCTCTRVFQRTNAHTGNLTQGSHQQTLGAGEKRSRLRLRQIEEETMQQMIPMLLLGQTVVLLGHMTTVHACPVVSWKKYLC